MAVKWCVLYLEIKYFIEKRRNLFLVVLLCIRVCICYLIVGNCYIVETRVFN